MAITTRDVKSIAKSGSAKLKGDVTVSQGTNVTLTQSGQDISIAASGSADGAIFKYRIVGTTADRLHSTAITSFGAVARNIVTTDKIRAFPFITSQAITLDRIGIQVSSFVAAGNTARLGIYNDNGSLYPGTLLLDAGTVATDSNGVKLITISQALSANSLYWLAVNASLSVQTYTYGGSGASIPLLGALSSDISTANVADAYDVASAYGALPNPYPASATISALSTPMLVRILS